MGNFTLIKCKNLNVIKKCLIYSGIVLIFMSLLYSCAAIQKNGQSNEYLVLSGLSPINPQPNQGSLEPGLSVLYFYNYFERHLDPYGKGAFFGLKGIPGKPIPVLDHQFDKNKVFDSGVNQGIGIRMTGLIHLTSTGTYSFRAYVNDGIRVYIDEKMIIDDPQQLYGDRYTKESVVEISKSGWYRIKVEYFQRKGTAAVRLLWKEPEGKQFVSIPARAYSHAL